MQVQCALGEEVVSSGAFRPFDRRALQLQSTALDLLAQFLCAHFRRFAHQTKARPRIGTDLSADALVHLEDVLVGKIFKRHVRTILEKKGWAARVLASLAAHTGQSKSWSLGIDLGVRSAATSSSV